MAWSRWVEDTIYSLYRRYDVKGCKEQQDNGDIYPLYPQDESECLPYHVFWYGDDE